MTCMTSLALPFEKELVVDLFAGGGGASSGIAAAYREPDVAVNPGVKDRVNAVNAMFLNAYGERRYKVNIDQCPKLTQCLERQVYDDKGAPDKKGGFDHMVDAMGYMIAQRYGLANSYTLANVSNQ